LRSLCSTRQQPCRQVSVGKVHHHRCF